MKVKFRRQLEEEDSGQHKRGQHAHPLNVSDGNFLRDDLHIVSKPNNQRGKREEINMVVIKANFI